MIKSQSMGHETEYKNGKWIYADTKKSITKDRPCKYCQCNPIRLRVNIPKELSHTGKSRWDIKPIDWCISDIVKALNNANILTKHSCCGHGDSGEIMLQDGRKLIIKREHNG